VCAAPPTSPSSTPAPAASASPVPPLTARPAPSPLLWPPTPSSSLDRLRALVASSSFSSSSTTAAATPNSAAPPLPEPLRALLIHGEAGFCAAVYPGVGPDALPLHLPRSLPALLAPPPSPHAPLAARVAEAAVGRARQVLDAVKRKALASGSGQVLDAATERALWPQVFGEAFARALPAELAADSARTHAAAAREDALLASPYHFLAACEQVDGESLARLCAGPRAAGWAGQRGPFHTTGGKGGGEEGEGEGEEAREWAELVRDDALRLVVEERGAGLVTVSEPASRSWKVRWSGGGGGGGIPLIVTVTTSTCWLDALRSRPGAEEAAAAAKGESPLAEQYPALSELVARLYALPYECNRKVPALRLLQPLPGMVLLRHMRVELRREGDGVLDPAVELRPLRLALGGGDEATGSSAARGAADPGYKLTAVYSPGQQSTASSTSGPILSFSIEVVGRAAGGDEGEVALPLGLADRLLLHSSRQLGHRVVASVDAGDGALRLLEKLEKEGSIVEDVVLVLFYLHGRDEGGLWGGNE
jgi:hypothetical protein